MISSYYLYVLVITWIEFSSKEAVTDITYVLINSIYFVVLATSCQVYLSECSYHADSVTRSETASANCRSYTDDLGHGVSTKAYIYCNGTQLKLTDSKLGQDQYRSSDYYVSWNKP